MAEDGGDAGGAGRRKRLAVFVSGGGSNFRAIHEAALAGEVHGDVVALVTDKPGEENRIPPAARVASGWMFLVRE
jgi:phosphoribosylglycinamide formyltransferase